MGDRGGSKHPGDPGARKPVGLEIAEKLGKEGYDVVATMITDLLLFAFTVG
ncbi:MAG: hypothetical protein JRJ85_22760 [Deltaproteobacteria bacterium]|nr:hypothetical protein [Deltaproteobacteria bacterium]